MINALRGMKDVFFEDGEKFEKFLEIAVKSAKNYGFTYCSVKI